MRKIAPRILIGVIGINLSIYLCIAAIDITNVIGSGIGDMLREPFIKTNSFGAVKGIEPNTENTIVGVVGVGAIGALVAAIIATKGALAVSILGILLPLLTTILLVAVAVLAVIVIRYGLVIFLSVISPVAIACYILPGTEQYFRRWWDIFIKTLLVYPIIAVFFAMSDILAAIFLKASGEKGDGIGLVFLFVTIVALIVPIFLIVYSFKLAGGLMAQVMNFAEGRSRNVAGSVNERIRRSREDPNTWLGKNAYNTKMWRRQKGLYGGDVISGATRGLGERMRGRSFRQGWQDSRRATREARGAALAGALAQNSEYAKATAQIDEAQMDMAAYGSGTDARAAIANGTHISMQGAVNKLAEDRLGRKLDFKKIHDGDLEERRALGSIMELGDPGIAQRQEQLRMYSAMNDKIGRSTATRAAAAKSGAALSYGYDAGSDGWNQAVDIANNIYGNDQAQVLSHMNELQYVAGQVGRSDLSGNVNNLDYNEVRAGAKVSGANIMAQGKPASVTGVVKEQLEVLRAADQKYENKVQAARILADLEASAKSPYSNAANKEELAKYSAQIKAELDQHLFNNPEMQQAAQASGGENVFVTTKKSQGTKTTRDASGTEITVPHEVEVSGAAAAKEWYRQQSGGGVSQEDVLDQQRQAEAREAEE